MKERSDKYNAAIIEYTYMVAFLIQLKSILNENDYKRIKRKFDEELMKKKILYGECEYSELFKNNLECA